ncbi:error-prone DNA polymerase [Breoghania sp.]|uniref:error-prone DNA polymerase n=1 Tax=Breoghania sp. TaxID=2065378 RepID=UPI002AA7890F|nr:error-prone DNA polymerase [Breoghania sp.]
MTRYAELCAATNFSFLRGASHPEELAVAAAQMGLAGLGVCDRNSLAGVVRTHLAAKEAGLRYAPGCRLVFSDGTPDVLAWPRDRAAHGRLTRLLTLGNRRAPKGQCLLALDDLRAWGEGLELGVMPPASPTAPKAPILETLRALADTFPGAVRLIATMPHGPSDGRRLAGLAQMASAAEVPLMASNDVLYHAPHRRRLQDVLTCIREHVTLREAGRRLEANAERHLKAAPDMARLFRAHPDAIDETLRLLERLTFSLDDLAYEYPDEPVEGFADPQAALEHFTQEGARLRYPDGVPDKVRAALSYELGLIRELQYAPYFLTVFDIVRFARSRAILCQGRGSAANSAVCFCLGITEVDPARADLLFERFISPERREPPDIDVDFEHERREEVIQYIYARYSRERAGLAATVITYRARSALREVGKAFGLSQDAVAALAGTIWGSSKSGTQEAALRAGLDPKEHTLSQVLELSRAIAGFPRHLSQHVGGFVITRGRLDELAPIQNAAMPGRTVIEWDKDDLDALGIMKIDILALGMLSAISKALEMLQRHYRLPLTIATIPAEVPAVYDMLCRADSVGVFQVESRAQMTMLPRLRPREFYDLVIEVAIVRPGPIQGDMVHPYLRRRQGLEDVSYPKEELRAVLHKTLGVPLFQEQAMRIAIVAAGFTPSEADRLRRAMATFRRVGTIGTFQTKMIEGMAANGYERDFAERCFRQIEGFGEYGFPESHAASFALLVYASSWLKCFYPDAFCAAILNAQPMGFYAPAQLVRDAREHGVEIRPVDINHSGWDNDLEAREPEAPAPPLHANHRAMAGVSRARHAVRLGLRQVKGLKQNEMEQLTAARGRGYDSIRDLWLRTGLSRATIERLADADAFRSIGLDRREALWAARALAKGKTGAKADLLPLFDVEHHGDLTREPDADLPPMPMGEQVVNDYRYLRLSLKAHPVSFVRAHLHRARVRPNADLAATPSGRNVCVAGLVLIRQRPGTAKGVIFMTLEDETGVANIIVWPKVFEKFRAVVLGARIVQVRGTLQSAEGVIHVVAHDLRDVSDLLQVLSSDAGDMDATARGDEVKRPIEDFRHKPKPGARVRSLIGDPRGPEPAARDQAPAAAVMPKGRNFH